MKRTLRILRWTLFNGLAVTLGYYGLVEHVEWARRAFIFWFWFIMVISSFMLAPDVRTTAAKQAASLPAGIDQLFDFLVCLGLAAIGHYGLAIGWLWQLLMCSLVFARREELAKEQAAQLPTS